jgi:hypothetical protein
VKSSKWLERRLAQKPACKAGIKKKTAAKEKKQKGRQQKAQGLKEGQHPVQAKKKWKQQQGKGLKEGHGQLLKRSCGRINPI